MKFVIKIVLLLIPNIILSQIGNIEFEKNVEILSIEKVELFSYYRVLKEGSFNYQINTKKHLNIKSSKPVDLKRLIKNENEIYNFPTFYNHDALNDIFVINKYDFIELVNYLKSEPELSEVTFDDTLIKKEKKYKFYQRSYKNVRIARLKMNLGYFNKYTSCVNAVGNYDDKINVIFLIL